jgi:Mitochondrial carrier protein
LPAIATQRHWWYTHITQHATAGSIIGVGEIALLPLDALKIKLQTNTAAYEGKSIMQIIRSEGWGLYRGASWTAARNAPGSFALFGGSAAVKEYVFKLEDYSKATFFHNLVASISGAFFSITLSAPVLPSNSARCHQDPDPG